MNRVRVKDLALVAVAGGLLAFELVSIGEVLPNVKKALAERTRSEKVEVASARAAGLAVPVVAQAVAEVAPKTSEVVAAAATSHAHRIAASTAAAPSKRCVAVARARAVRRAHERMRFVTVSKDGSCSAHEVAQIVEKRKEIAKAVDLALKQATL